MLLTGVAALIVTFTVTRAPALTRTLSLPRIANLNAIRPARTHALIAKMLMTVMGALLIAPIITLFSFSSFYPLPHFLLFFCFFTFMLMLTLLLVMMIMMPVKVG